MQRSKLPYEPTPEDFAFSLLLSYAAYQWPRYETAKHHRLIAQHLEAVERGEITRLIITMPPRHGKSMLASEFFPAWFLGRNPEQYVIAASYAQELADDFGRKVRNQLLDPCYQAIFPTVGLREDSTSSKRFHTTKGGTYNAVGVGGPITGRGAHLLLIDDPIKNREEAESETIREKIKGWYTSTAYTRLMPGGRIVIIQTRWHEDDLAGWLLEEHKQEGWVHLDLPAISEDGGALWPEHYPLERLEQIKLAIGTMDWSALYQQRPSPEEGEFFKKEWFRYYEDPPKHLRIYGASDYAVTDKGGDYTVHGVFGVDPNDNVYVLDWWRGRTDSLVWVEQFIEMVKQHKPLQWAEEGGQIIKSIGPLIDKRQRETGAWCYRKQYASTTKKDVRAQSIRGRMAQGKVYFPKHASWMAELESEMLVFPNGKHDDQVDVLSLLGRMLAEMQSATLPEPEKPREINTQLPTMAELSQDFERRMREEEERERF